MTTSITSITSAAAKVLIASGKAAVEQALSNIEADLETAKTKAVNEASTLATELAAYLQAHATEVSTAQSLIARTLNTTAAASPSSVLPPGAPAITLSKPRTIGNFIAGLKAWLTKNGWKGYVLLGLGVLVLHYMWTHKIII